MRQRSYKEKGFDHVLMGRYTRKLKKLFKELGYG